MFITFLESAIYAFRPSMLLVLQTMLIGHEYQVDLRTRKSTGTGCQVSNRNPFFDPNYQISHET